MKHWNPKGIRWVIVTIALLLCALLGRQKSGVSARERNADMPRFLSEPTLPILPETVTVPAGTRIQIRLKDAISTEENSSGDHFTAFLDGPLIVDAQFLSPSRNKIIGELNIVEAAGRVNGRARLTMVLKELIVNSKEYMLETQPLIAQNPLKEDAQVINRGATPDAANGETAGEGESAAIGTTIGGGSGAEYTLATKGGPVSYEPGSRFTFTLSAPVELPVIRKMGGTHAAMAFSHKRGVANATAIKDRSARQTGIHSVGRTENEN